MDLGWNLRVNQVSIFMFLASTFFFFFFEFLLEDHIIEELGAWLEKDLPIFTYLIIT